MNGDGSVSLDGTGPAFGNGLCTAVAGNAGLTNNRFNFTGVAFGGGFYAEAVMKGTSHELLGQWYRDDERRVSECWSQPLAWSGCWLWWLDRGWQFDDTNVYGLAFHNWYGQVGNGGDSTSVFDKIQPTPTPDYTQYHKYGFLWVLLCYSPSQILIKFFFSFCFLGSSDIK
jgi:hypothetical protein